MTRQVTKAVIPAAGLGTRFLPASKSTPKEMLPLVDRPTIQWVVEEAVDAGITDILVVTGRGKGDIEDHFDRSFELEASLEAKGKTEALAEVRAISELADIHYVRQGEPKGLGHAVGAARRHVGDQPFAVLLGDDVMHPAAGLLRDMVGAFARRDAAGVVALLEVPREEISSYGAATVEAVPGEDRLVRLREVVEKPDPADAPSTLAVIGRYVFGPEIFEQIERTPPGKGGEIQLTDAYGALAREADVYGWTFSEGRYDAGNKQDYLRATVELALERDDLGPGLRRYLRGLADAGRL